MSEEKEDEMSKWEQSRQEEGNNGEDEKVGEKGPKDRLPCRTQRTGRGESSNRGWRRVQRRSQVRDSFEYAGKKGEGRS